MQLGGFALSLTGLYLYKQFKSTPSPAQKAVPLNTSEQWEQMNDGRTLKKLEVAIKDGAQEGLSSRLEMGYLSSPKYGPDSRED